MNNFSCFVRFFCLLFFITGCTANNSSKYFCNRIINKSNESCGFNDVPNQWYRYISSGSYENMSFGVDMYCTKNNLNLDVLTYYSLHSNWIFEHQEIENGRDSFFADIVCEMQSFCDEELGCMQVFSKKIISEDGLHDNSFTELKIFLNGDKGHPFVYDSSSAYLDFYTMASECANGKNFDDYIFVSENKSIIHLLDSKDLKVERTIFFDDDYNFLKITSKQTLEVKRNSVFERIGDKKFLSITIKDITETKIITDNSDHPNPASFISAMYNLSGVELKDGFVW